MKSKKTLIIALTAVVIIAVGIFLGVVLTRDNDTGDYLTLDSYRVTEQHYIYYCARGYDAAYVETGIYDSSIWDQKIDGKNTADWIKSYADKQAERYLVVNKLFNELGLEFTKEEISVINDEVNELWVYGGVGNAYEKMGIEQIIYNDIYTTEKRGEKLAAYFSEELGQSISETDIESYLNENYASVIYFAMSYTDGNSESTQDQYEAYCKEVENGKSLEELVKEIEASDNEFVVTSIASGNGRTDTIITASGSGFPLDYVQELFEAENGALVPYDDAAGNIYVLSQRRDILADNYYLELYHDEIVDALLSARLEDKLAASADEYQVKIHRAAKSFDVEALYKND